ncbi:MAG: YihY/virulence factor BrkB family protein [Candidatus Methylacidiphilales bacterium]
MVLVRLLGRELPEKLGFISSFAAALAFYFVTSLIPFVALALIGVGTILQTNVTPEFVDILNSIIPVGMKVSPEMMDRTLKHFTGGGFALFSVLLALWTSSNFMNELARALHFIFADGVDLSAGGLVRRLKSLMLLLVWLLTLMLSAVLLVLTPFLEAMVAGLMGLSPYAGDLVIVFRYVSAIVILFYAISFTYKVIPRMSPPKPLVYQGSTLATLAWIGSGLAFSQVVGPLWSQSYLHGAVGAVLLTLLWSYTCAWGLLAGAIWIKRGVDRR